MAYIKSHKTEYEETSRKLKFIILIANTPLSKNIKRSNRYRYHGNLNKKRIVFVVNNFEILSVNKIKKNRYK